jgi:hypothetical protein
MGRSGVGVHRATAAVADEPKAAASDKLQTFQGELLDMNCYMAHEGKGEKHKSCAQACIKGGAPMGLLTSDGKVFLIVEAHEKTKPYEALKALAGEQVQVKGALFERGGVAALQVDSFEAKK